MARLLVVEDEADLAGIVADYARAAGHEVEVLADGAQALERLRSARPDLVVLDLMLPGLDGLSVCRALRGFSDVPVVMVTARVEEIDRLLGLEVGADDYVCKPFSPRELMMRVAAILRRTGASGVAAAGDAPLVLDEAAHQVRVEGRPLDLTPTEFELFALMARRPGRVWSRAQLLEHVRGDALDVNDRVVDSHVKNLRRKLDARLPGRDIVQSVYGVGYRVEMPAPSSGPAAP